MTKEEELSAKTFAENLQYQLNRNNRRQIDLAAELGVSTAIVSNWISAKKMPRMDKISRMAKWLSCSLSDLLEPRKPMDESTEQFRARAYKEYGALFDLADKATPMQRKQAEDYLRFLLSQNDDTVGK